MAQVDFYYDVVCPYAYLAHTQIERICAEAGAELRWKPILLGGLFRVIGAGDGPMPGMPAAKARLNLLDMHRWSEHWEVPLSMPAEHPRRTVLAMRTILASDQPLIATKALYQAYWVDGRDVTEPNTVTQILSETGLDGAALVARASEPEIKQALHDSTNEAAAAGAFGVPACVVHTRGHDPELFWGQDRLVLVSEFLAKTEAA